MIWVEGLHSTSETTYEGEWDRGIQHGSGSLILPDGTMKEGYFDNNVYVGTVRPMVSSASQEKKPKAMKRNFS